MPFWREALVADSFKTIIEDLSGGVSVLTVNRRLGRSLLRRYERAMTESGQTIWKSPIIMPLLSWAEGLREGAWPDRPLLSDTRSLAIWKKIVFNDRLSGGLIFPRGAAREAYKAYVLMRRYKVRLPADDTYLTEEARVFKGWLGLYEDELRRLGFTDYPCLMEGLRPLIAEGRVTIPKRIILAGFDEITPDVEALLTELRDAGTEALFWPEKPGSLRAISKEAIPAFEIREYGDELEEVRSCARWARLEAENNKRVGIIVPELSRYRAMIINEFSAELDPPSALPWGPAKESFNISLGLSLEREPLIRSLLGIISTGLGAVPLETMLSILSSPYFIFDDDESMAFAAFARRLREKICGEITLWELKRAVDRENRGQLDGLSERLELWIKALQSEWKARRLPGLWAGFFDGLLKELSWPAKGLTLNSREFQALTAWHKLLSEFAGLDDLTGKLNGAGAATELCVMAAETIHQPESGDDSPVEVLGLLESSGLSFDCVWILGAHEGALPGPCAPNPFIPMDLQKKAGFARATPELTLAFARQTLERVMLCAPEAVASFARIVEDKERKASPLLAGRGKYIKEPPRLPGHRLKDMVHASYAVEALADNKGAPLGAEELAGLHGGTGIIKEQSACPFRAFALYRLSASALRIPEPGLDAMERGSLVHEALNIFWSLTRDSEGLAKAQNDGSLEGRIREAVSGAIAGFHRKGIGKKILALEAERLQRLLNEWIKVELTRDAFIVAETEVKHEIEVGGLSIRTRLDRVDELVGGERIIIDYKTGPCAKDYWLPGRPKEPQMLIYAFHGGFNAIAFASLGAERPCFVGVSQRDGMLPKVKGIESDDKWRSKVAGVNNWAELNARWKETLSALADDFLRGVADVDPNEALKGRESPCEYCEFIILCRKTELGFFNHKEED